MDDNNIILVIGDNGYGQLGLKTTNDVPELVKFHTYNENRYVTSIYSGRYFTIFADHRSQTYFSVGYNLSGQCGIGNNECIIKQLQIIKYFHKNNIRIQSIKTSPNGYNTFWITNKNKIYSHGPNRRSYQLGLTTSDENDENDEEDINEPRLINDLFSKCIDIQCAYGYNIALCINRKLMDYDVLSFYCFKYTNYYDLPKEIVNIIIIYCDINEVYSVGKCIFGANGHKQNVKQWRRIEFFDERQIKKIRTGLNHSLFLDFDGNLFCCGRCEYGQLGLGFEKKLKDPQTERNELQQITFFSNKNIKICDIQCGWYHNLAIDENYNLWVWGDNTFGQCGDNEFQSNILWPTQIKYFKQNNIKIKKIQCGSHHSAVLCVDNKYYMFGDNQYNQCITYDHMMKVSQPFCINHNINKVTNGGKILQISLGCGNTKIISDRP